MKEHSTWNQRLSPTVEEAQRIVDRRTEEQRKFYCALDPKAERAYNFEKIGKNMGVTADEAERIYNSIGDIIEEELGTSFNFDVMYQHVRTSRPHLLFDVVKRDRWYFTLGPELHVALVKAGILQRNPPRKAK